MMGRIRRIYAKLYGLWEGLDSISYGKPAFVFAVLLLLALAVAGGRYGMMVFAAVLSGWALLFYLLGKVLDLLGFARRSWIGYASIAALAWRIAVPVQRCDSRYSGIGVGR